MKLLLQGGVDIDYQGYDGKTPLIVACSFLPEENTEKEPLLPIIKLLLKEGADPNVHDLKGRTAIMYAFRHALSIDIVETLIQNGADPTKCDMNGLNAFDFLSKKVWPKYRHYMKSIDQYKHKVLSDKSCEVDKDAPKQRKNVKTSLTIVQNSSNFGGRLCFDQRNAFRRTSEVPSPVCDTNGVYRRKTKSFCTDLQNNLKLCEKTKTVFNDISEKATSDENMNRFADNIEWKKRVHEDVCKKEQNKHASCVFLPYGRITSDDKQTVMVTGCSQNSQTCRKSGLDLIILDNMTSKSRKKSVMLVKVSSIDKATVEDGTIKIPAKLPPIK